MSHMTYADEIHALRCDRASILQELEQVKAERDDLARRNKAKRKAIVALKEAREDHHLRYYALKAERDELSQFLAQTGASCEILTNNLQHVRQERDAMKEALTELVMNSEGVYGLHLNGDPAPWGDLLYGGAFEEWLAPFGDLTE